MKRQAAFSLMELLVGIFVLAMISGAFIVALQGNKREVVFGAEHFSGMLLSAKVVEDCVQEMAINPYGFETLGISDTPIDTEITNGQSIFFSGLEDTRPPWGLIDQVTDGAIDSNMPVLFPQVKQFKLSVGANRLAPTTDTSNVDRNLCRIDVRFSWPAVAGKGEYFVSTLCPSPVSAKTAPTGVEFSLADIEKEVCENIYTSSPTKTFSEILNTYAISDGGATLLALGKIRLGTRTFFQMPQVFQARYDIEKAMAKAEQRKTSSSYPTLEDFLLVRKAASESYNLAREAFRFLRYLDPAVQSVSGNLDQANLGSPLVNNNPGESAPYRYLNPLRDYLRLSETFIWSLYKTSVCYESLLTQPMRKHQDNLWYYFHLQRAISLYKVSPFVPGSTLTPQHVNRFFSYLKATSQGRYPALWRLASQELTWALPTAIDRNRLIEKNPGLSTLIPILDRQKAFIETFPASVTEVIPPEPTGGY